MSSNDEDSNLNVTENSVHTAEKPLQIGSFVCSFDNCMKSYSRLAHLKRHEESHGEKFKCLEENCGMIFKSQYSLKRHTDNIHLKKKPKKYKCKECGEEFNKHNWLTRHEYHHTGVKPYECTVEGCNARFLVPSKLRRHMKIHKGYTCTNCGQLFLKWTLYVTHLRQSHPPTFRCHYCEKTFSRLQNLKAHLELHNFDREVFLCPKPGCSRFYFMKRNLTHHIKSYHDKRPFTCTEENCSKAFKSEEDLNTHIARHDPNRRIRKRKRKSKPKPTLAAKLAGLAPKKWQVEAVLERGAGVNACSSKNNEVEQDKSLTDTAEKQAINLHATEKHGNDHHLTFTEAKQATQTDISKNYENINHSSSPERRNSALSESENSDFYCSSDNDVSVLLKMVQNKNESDSETQKRKCISVNG